MASLRSYLPPAGSTVWRNERRLTRTSSSGEAESGLSKTRIKHIVVREVWKRDLPSPHALYKIDVMTQSNHWFILRRYREFHSLHLNLVKKFNIPSDMLPTKKLFSNMSLTHLEKRRNALEHYLQRLINSHHDIAESQELFQFLNVQTHDVLCVTRQLAKVLKNEGRNILASGGVFTFSPTQMYCITRQLQLPHVAIEQSDTSNPGDEVVDLGYLYDFIQELKSLCVSGVVNRSSPCQEVTTNQAFDISLFKSLQKLQIEKCHIHVIDGLYRIQKQLTHVTLKNCLKSMKEFLVEAAMQKRTVKQAASNVESWRNMSTTKLTDNRVVVCPWFLLTHINMSYNSISTLDHSLKLLPCLEQLDLSYNEFVHVDLEQLTSSTLTFLNLSHNNIHYISATSRDLRNLKSLLLANNKLQHLEGIDCLRGLVELDVRSNEISAVEELVKISSLLHLRILALTGNPCVVSKSYRIQAFCQLKARELILDGIKITESEKAKVHLVQGRKVSSTDGEPSHKPNTQTQSDQDMKKKNTPYRDDDQDSGFGGTYAGSIDEGGLVFDWSCYSNNMDITCDFFPYHVAGPSTSRTMLRSPHTGTNTYVNLVSECEISSQDKVPDTEKERQKHSDMSSSESGLISKSSDTKNCSENVFQNSADFRGKQPVNNQRFSKRNIKSSSSPRSTLLQLSINEAVSKENETKSQLRNNIQSINTKSILQNTNSIQDKTSSIRCKTTSIEENTESIQGNTPRNMNSEKTGSIQEKSFEDSANFIHENTSSVQDSTPFVQEDTTSVQESTTSVQDNTSSDQKNTTSVQENTTSVQENTTFVQDNTTSVQDNTTSVQDNMTSVQDNTTSALDNNVLVQNNRNTIQDNKHSIPENINFSQENTTCVRDEQPGGGISREVALTND